MTALKYLNRINLIGAVGASNRNRVSSLFPSDVLAHNTGGRDCSSDGSSENLGATGCPLPVMKAELSVKIVPVESEEQPVIANFFHNHFYTGEPLNVSLDRVPPADSIPFISLVNEGLSFKAVNLLEKSEDNIAGVVINAEASLGKKKQSVPGDTKALKIRELLKELDEKSKIWEVVNNENHFNIVAVAVDKKYYGHKLGQKLVEESLKLAKSLNYKHASIECSSFYSAKFAVEMGFELLAEIPYDQYLGENNEQVFKVSKPHTAIKKFVKRL